MKRIIQIPEATVPPILKSWVKGDALTTKIGDHVVLILPERSEYQDTIVQADMMAQLAKYWLTFADIKEGTWFEVQTEWWIPLQGASTQWGSTLTFTINAHGSFLLESQTLGGTEWTYFAGDLSPIYLGKQPQNVVNPDGTFVTGVQFDYITSEGRMRRFADNNTTPRIVSMKKL